MDIESLVERLRIAHQPIDEFEEEEEELIEEEIKYLLMFIEKIYPFATKKNIHGKDCVLIYVYSGSKNYAVSNDVYLSPLGYVTYQVFDEDTYRQIVPDADIENGFVKVRIDYFLKHAKSLPEIIRFFEKRPEYLKEKGYHIFEKNKKRKHFLHKFKEAL